MPYGSWVNDLPTGFFLPAHTAAPELDARAFGFAYAVSVAGSPSAA
jgi:hypothetical protein